jgi:ketosteroid isomerase-like protein
MSELETRQSENVGLVEDAFAAFSRGDAETVLGFMDAEIEVHTAMELLNAGTYRGHDGYLKWLGQWLEAWEDFEMELEEIEPVGEHHVVALAHQTARGKGSGVPVELRVGWMLEIRDRRGVRLHLYPDLDQARAEAERGERGSDE